MQPDIRSTFEEGRHVFIVRIRREAREIPDAPPEWRGMIEYMPTGERRYFRDLNEITAFVGRFVPDMERGLVGQTEGKV